VVFARLAIATALLVVLVILVLAAPPHGQTVDDPVFDQLSALITAKMAEYHVPGVAIGVLRRAGRRCAASAYATSTIRSR